MTAMAKYGRGVFTITMANNSIRHQFKMYLYRHPEIYQQLTGTNGDIKIFQLNKEGMKAFGGTLRGHNMINTWASILDVALINGYMIESQDIKNYSMKPHSHIEISNKRVGIISNRWGLTKNVGEIDVLLGTKSSVSNLLEAQEELESLAKRESISVEKLTTIIEKTITPKSLLFLR